MRYFGDPIGALVFLIVFIILVFILLKVLAVV